MDLNTLEPGHTLADREIVITEVMADAYIRAVGDECARCTPMKSSCRRWRWPRS